MYLKLTDSSNVIDYGFGLWLISKIKTRLLSNIDTKKLVHWNNYFSELPSNEASIQDNSSQQIIVFAVSNLTCKLNQGELIITYDQTKFIPGYDRLKLSTAIKTINYGTLSIKGYPIFSDTFKYFAENIDTYIKLYYNI